MTESILEVSGLTKHFKVGSPLALGWKSARFVHALDDVNFSVSKGRTLGVVGESGCGKTTLSRVLLSLVQPTSGDVRFDGMDLGSLSRSQRLRYRTGMQAVFQDPYGSLDPRMRVRDIVLEPLRTLGHSRRSVVKDRLDYLLEAVGLSPGAGVRYPHEFSGGQRQRVAIARALSVEPKFLVLDEPVSALDVSIRAQVINLLLDLQETMGLTYLLIAHDLAVVAHASDEIAVMYLGQIVELASARQLVREPLHPYTELLMAAHPVPNPDAIPIERQKESELPSPINPPSGCRFRTRCPIAEPYCAEVKPEFRQLSPGHWVACHLR